MTFDDGILTIYAAKNEAYTGLMPQIVLHEKERFYFSFDTLGISRYYTALQARQQIEAVVNIPGWPDICATDICALEDGRQYRIVMRQPTLDDQGLRITKLSLERLGDKYAVFKTDGDPEDSQSDNA